MPKRKGFWGMLEDLFGGSDDHELYAEGVRRGGTMLSARVDDDLLDEAVEILDRHGSIDLAEREVSWRHDGWLGGSVGMPSGAALLPAALGSETAVTRPVMPPPVEPAPLVTPASFALSSRWTLRSNFPWPRRPAMLPGSPRFIRSRPNAATATSCRSSRSVSWSASARSGGKVRIHSHMVERPVVEEVSLRDETIRVDRHPVDRALSAGELTEEGFQDRLIEMEEVDQEAVVSKTARVVEEIGLRKDVTSRTETVHDTVRRTKVDIDDSRHGVAADDAEVAMSPGPAGDMPIKPA